MKLKHILLFISLFSLAQLSLKAKDVEPEALELKGKDEIQSILPQYRFTYKSIDSVKLVMEAFYPPDMNPDTKYPVIVFFFGGGWKGGSLDQFEQHARHFASRGMIAIRVDYRVNSRHGTTPFDAVRDAKSAIRFLRKNADLMQIDANRIVASGGSAGGHLAAAAGNLPGLDEPSEDLSISSKPDVLVLFNPVFDNGPDGYGYNRIGDRYPEISPLHNIRPGAPPTIIFLGTQDRLIPVETAKNYQEKMEAVGSRCELFLYEGQKHGFFNYRHTENYQKTRKETDRFLVSLGYIPEKNEFRDPTLKQTVIISERMRIMQRAERFRDEPPLSVASWTSERSAGGKNDFYSEGDYWWPDPDNPDGPYIRRDGLSNPDNFSKHRHAMIRMSKIVGTMASAYQLTGEDRYVENAMKHLRAWFIDPETQMNPHMLYAQAIKGRHTGRGIGIIDALHLVEPALAVKAMEDSKAISKEELHSLKNWFGDFLEWISTHEYGRAEMVHPNNHGTCWAVQASAYAYLTGDHEMLKFCTDRYTNHLLPAQMAADGSFPLELERTKPYGYSIFNLDAMSSLAQILSLAGYPILDYSLDDVRSLKLGTEFLFPYIVNKEDWPYEPDVLYFDEYPVKQAFLLFGGLAFDKPEYIRIWLDLESDPDHNEVVRNTIVKNPLLWLDF